MTGYQSKKAMARDKLDDDDDTQVYKDHGDALTIAYQSGYYDGKKAAQAKVEGPLHVVCQCDKCKAQPEQEPVAWWNNTGTHIDLNVSGRGTPLYTTPPQRTWANVPDEEIKILWIQYRAALPRYLCFAKALLARAKEKNT